MLMFLVSYLALNIFEYLLSFCGVCVKLQKASSVSVKVRTSNGHLDRRQEKDPIAMAIVRAQSPSSSCCRSNGLQNMSPLMDFWLDSILTSPLWSILMFRIISGFLRYPGLRVCLAAISFECALVFGIWWTAPMKYEDIPQIHSWTSGIETHLI